MHRQDSFFDLCSAIPQPTAECIAGHGEDMDDDDLLKMFEITDAELDAIIAENMQKDTAPHETSTLRSFDGQAFQHVEPSFNQQPVVGPSAFNQQVVGPSAFNQQPVVMDPAALSQQPVAHSPVAQQQAQDTKEVSRIKSLLSAFKGDDAYLENADLVIIYKNMAAFNDDDLWKIPNVYLRGTGSLAVKHACEIMLCIKMICIDHDIDLRKVLSARFSNSVWVDCPCVNATGKNKGDVCDRERRYGMLACSRHTLSLTRDNIIEYCSSN